MNVELAVLADWAAVTPDGKLVVAGVFDTLRPLTQFPYIHPSMSLALRVSSHPGEPDAHHLTLRMVDPDGNLLVPEVNADFQFAQPGVGRKKRRMQFVMALQLVGFRVAGPHAVDILVDGRHEETVAIDVEPPQPGMPQPGIQLPGLPSP